MSDLAKTIHQAITDQTFRDALTADPTATLSRYGLELSEQEIDALSDAIHLVGCSSEDLLRSLLATAIGPMQVWQAKAVSQRYSVSEL